EKRVHEEDLPYFLGLMEHLSAAGISCPTPIADREGNVLQKVAGRPAAIVTFLSGYAMRKPRVEHCRPLGAALAELHLAGASFPMKRRNTLSLDGWEAILASLDGEPDKLKPGMTAQLAAELEELKSAWPRGLPEGVIHADLFPDNVFFLGETVSGLIDFYFACN